MIYVMIAVAVIALSAAHLLIKKGMLAVGQFPQEINQIIPFFLKTFTNPYIITAIILAVVTMIAWIIALSKAQLSYLYPFMALTYVLVTVFSMLLFKEDVTLLRWLGIAAICIGVFLVFKS